MSTENDNQTPSPIPVRYQHREITFGSYFQAGQSATEAQACLTVADAVAAEMAAAFDRIHRIAIARALFGGGYLRWAATGEDVVFMGVGATPEADGKPRVITLPKRKAGADREWAKAVAEIWVFDGEVTQRRDGRRDDWEQWKRHGFRCSIVQTEVLPAVLVRQPTSC